ncbi:S-layer homology domain-containing protein [Paenibacillus rigui]|uniref:Ig domain-containing protein group 2 domain-containing protein n=1 Tax=Paenibacillus rigui TaxID=554312 RepID=A0A229UVG4_9BACL|nr:DUF4350 domain-containing protein [Paenibacillus rigui]OXM87313.1 Ig domain-containing protein group 2 domain-containing protein [Paenibacillus rigui]
MKERKENMTAWLQKGKRWTSLALAFLLLIGSFVPQPMLQQAKAAAQHVVINQIYGAGGNGGATYKNDFIELYNPMDQEIDLSGWSVQYASSTGSTWQVTNLTKKIPAYGYYLISEAGGTNGSAIPSADDTGAITMSAAAGKVALVRSTKALTGGALPADYASVDVVDYVGYGSAAGSYEGTGPTPAPSLTNSVQRKGNGRDTDDNKNDFAAVPANPHNSSSPISIPNNSADPNPLLIQFVNQAGIGTITGDASSVTGGTYVSLYTTNPTVGGAVIESVYAAADGAFSLHFTNAMNASSVYVTSTEPAKAESNAVTIQAATPAVIPVSDKINYTIDATGKGTLGGAAGAAAPNAYIFVYPSSDTSVGNRFISLADGKDYVKADASGAFTVYFSNGTNDVYVTQLTYGSQGKSLESAAVAITKKDSNLITPISSLHTNDSNGKSDKINLAFTVQGVVTVAPNVIGSKAFYIQDATGGINVYGLPAGVTVTQGDLVTINGTIAFYNGLTELVPSTITKDGTALLPEPAVRTVTELTDYTKAESWEGSLVKVTGKVTSVPASADTGGGYNVTIADDKGKTMTLRVMATTDIQVAADIINGLTYTFTAMFSQYDSSSPYTTGYQIFPRSKADVVEMKQVSLQHSALTEAYTDTDVQFTASARNADSVTIYYRAVGASGYETLSMVSTDQQQYIAVLPKASVPANAFEYYVEAKAGSDIKQSGSPSAPYTVNVVADTFAPVLDQELPGDMMKVEDNRPSISVHFNEPSGLNVQSLQVLIDGADVTSQTSVGTDTIQLTLSSDLSIGSHTVNVMVSDTKGNPGTRSWTFQVVPVFTGGNHYRGTTHNHTNISHDGAGSPEAALQAAKAHKYDFFAFSDHSHDIDSTQVDQDTVEHKGQPERTGGADWQLTKKLAKDYTNDSFVVFPAFEMTATTWGHSNVFGTDNFIDRKQNGGLYQDLNKYYAWVMTYDDVAAQFNHPDMSANAFNNFMPYDAKVDNLFTMLEVGNGSGHYNYYNAEKKFYSALDLGWHVAPTFGEDNHDATWGQTMRRTVIVADDLSQESLLHSMRNMRVYMAEDPNFTLDVLANGQYMGATVKGKTLNFSVSGKDDVAESGTMPEYSYLPASYQADDRVAKVELITNGGKVIDSYSPMTANFTWNPNYTVTGGQQWFVVKVTQKDGDQIYSSPIWSEVVNTDVKISGVNVVGDSLTATIPATIQAGISNLGTQDITNLKAHFYYDSADSNHLIGETTIASIASKGTATASVIWGSPVSGNHTILVVIDGPPGDAAGDNIVQLPVQVKEPLGIKIVIDASHQNENTTKDSSSYKDNLKAVTKQLQQEGYTVVESTYSLASPSTLSDAQVLMITYPMTALTDDESLAVTAFVHNGGSLFLAGKSNNSTSPAEDNKLLAQIGSSIRINDDGIFDTSKDGNFFGDPVNTAWAVRLHPGLVKNRLTDRVLTVEYYSGASLESTGHAPLTDTDAVTILARGNETSYQSNIKNGSYAYDITNDTSGGSAIPVIASEQLGKGRVVVSGMNFLNDKQMDEAYNPKGNNELSLNVMNWLAHREPVVSSIAEVRAKEDGVPVVIEGTVTTAAGVFFDAFYVQDATGGIMAYKEAPEGSLKPGDKVRIYGQMKTFENNKELDFGSFNLDVIKLGHTDPVEPLLVSTGEASLEKNQGLLLKVKGKVASKYDENSYVVDDGSGPILVFTDGYIVNQSGSVPVLQAGDTLEAVGLAGKYAEGMRIRVRDTKELIKTAAEPSHDATLSGLSVSEGTLTPAFDPNTTEYTVEVYSASVAVTPVASSSASAMKVNGTATVSGAVYTQYLQSGVNSVSIQLTAEDGTTAKEYKLSIYRLSTGHGNNHKPGGSTSATIPEEQAGGVQGEMKSENGKARIDFTYEPTAMDAAIKGASNGKVTLKAVSNEIVDSTRVVVKQGSLQALLREPSLKILAIATPLGSYEIPVAQIQLGSWSAMSGIPQTQLDLTIDIRHDDYAAAAATKKGLQAKAAVEFTLTATTTEGQSKVISKFTQYVPRKLVIDSTLNGNNLAVVRVEQDGEGNTIYNPVPFSITGREVTIFSRTNSTYLVVENTKEFQDMSGHWARAEVQSMANKLIVQGTTDEKFAPDRTVTRAEFAALLVRTLGLTSSIDPKSKASFNDIQMKDWYNGVIAAAAEHRLVSGFEDGTYRPDDQMTRQEMTVMIYRAMQFAGYSQGTSSAPSFSDEKEVAGWAKEAMAALANMQIINGVTANKFAPNQTATRAESTVILNRMLNHLSFSK